MGKEDDDPTEWVCGVRDVTDFPRGYIAGIVRWQHVARGLAAAREMQMHSRLRSEYLHRYVGTRFNEPSRRYATHGGSERPFSNSNNFFSRTFDRIDRYVSISRLSFHGTFAYEF